MKKLFLLLTAIVTLALSASAQNRTYHGTVLSSMDDEPLVGVNVVPVGAEGGVITNVDGEFTITVPASVKQVKVSFIGMKPAVADLVDGMKVYLENDAQSLEGIIVTGYGSGKKLGSVVGSVAVVGQETFENSPAPNFVDALQGQVAGLNIYSSTGEPMSTPSSVAIRGINSMNASTAPLYILDGAPVTASVFNTLNPNDIENVTVLKDASSVAIYGSRAANGVIVITSKKGKYGEKARVSLRATYGWSAMVTDQVKMMNSQQYVQFRDIIGASVSQEVRNIVDTYGISTDWSKEMFNNHAPVYSLEGTVQGGSDTFSYYISLNHYDMEGIVEQSGMRRDGLRFALDSKVNSWLKVGLQGNLAYAKYQTNWISDAARSDNANYTNSPIMWARIGVPYDSPYYYTFNDNGDIVYGDRADYLHFWGNPAPGYSFKYSGGDDNRVTANLNLYEQINPVKGLTLRAQQAVDAYDNRGTTVNLPKPIFTTPMGDTYNPGVTPQQEAAGKTQTDGSAGESFSRYYMFTYTNTAEYRFDVAEKNHFTVLLGQESIITRSRGFSVNTRGQYNPKMMTLSNGTEVRLSGIGYSFSEYVMNSYFANLSYDFDGKYFVDASFRRDGSSKFAPGHRWSNFYSVGAMWNLKAEKFLQDVNWLSDLKVRAGYGTTGNSGIGAYDYYGLIANTTPYGGNGATVISGTTNPNLSWETVRSFDAGVSFGFFNSRLTGSVDFYKKKTCDMILDIPYSYTTGMGGAPGNIGAMTNTGVDVQVRGDIVRTADWYVGASVNFNYNKNELTQLYDGQDELKLPNYGLDYKVGHSPFEFYDVRYVGADPRDGKQVWLDKNGNRTKLYSEDNAVLLGKSYIAPWTGGFGVQAGWKGIRVSADFMWAADKYIISNANYFTRNPQMATQQLNQDVEMLKIWQKPGDRTFYAAATETYQFDSRWIEDASFMRLKNITVSYSLPKKWMDAASMQDVTFHFTGRNLWTITRFSGYDPEPQINNIKFFYPNTQQYEFGVEVTF